MKPTPPEAATISQQQPHRGRTSLAAILLNGIIDFGVFNIIIFTAGVGAVPANLISVTIAMALSFIARKSYVFGSRSSQILTQAALFILVTATGAYIIQTGALAILVHLWQTPMDVLREGALLVGAEEGMLPYAVAINGVKLAASALSAGWNRLLYRSVVFTDHRNRSFEAIGDWFAAHRRIVVLIGILALAALFRFWQLNGLPPGLHPEEAADGLTAAAIAEGGWQSLYQQTGGIGAPLHLLQAAAISLLGNTVLALRVVPAVLGVLAVWVTYMAAQTWFSQRVALLSSFLLASAPGAVFLSRISEPRMLSILLVPLVMWLAGRAVQTNKARWYVGTGVVLGGFWYVGLPVYTWIVFILVFALFARRYYRGYCKHATQPILMIILSALLVMLPSLVHYVATRGVSHVLNLGTEAWMALTTPLETLLTLGAKAVTVLGMFHFSGGQNVVYNLPGHPVLNGVTGILFLLGLMLALRRFRDARYAALLGVVAVMLLPLVFTADEASSTVWAGGVLPAVYILASIGLVELFARWRGVFPRNVLALQLSITVILIALGLSTWYNWQQYFLAWGNMPETFAAYEEPAHHAARYISRQETGGDTYVVASAGSVPVLRYMAEGEYMLVPPGYIQSGAPDAAQMIVVLRGNDTNERGLSEYEAEEVYSPHRVNTRLYTVYTQ